MGGLTAASTLRLFGFDVQVYEQAPGFARIGAQGAATAMEDAAVLAWEETHPVP